MSSEQTQATRTREDQQQVIKVSAFILTVYYIYTNTQLATLSVYSLQKYKFQLCNCFRSRAERLHMYLVNVLILLMSFEKYENIFLCPRRNLKHLEISVTNTASLFSS